MIEDCLAKGQKEVFAKLDNTDCSQIQKLSDIYTVTDSILFKYSPKVDSKLVPIHVVRHNKAVKTAISKFWPDLVDC